MKLKTKLIVMIVPIVSISALFIGALSFISAKKSLKQDAMEHLQLVAIGKESAIMEYLASKKGRTEDFASGINLRNEVERIIGISDIAKKKQAAMMLNRELKFSKKPLDPDIVEMHIYDMEGRIISSTDDEAIGTGEDNNQPFFSNGKKATYLQDNLVHKHNGVRHEIFAVAAPIKSIDGKRVIGVLMNGYELEELKDIISGKRYCKILAAKKEEETATGADIYMINQDRTVIVQPAGAHTGPAGIKTDTEPVRKCLNEAGELNGSWLDYQGKNVWGSSMCLEIEKDRKWVLLVEMDEDKAFVHIVQLRNYLFFIEGIVMLLVAALILALANSISKPLHELHKGTEIIGSGNLDYKVGRNTKDEVGQLSRAFDSMTENLKAITASRDELNKEIEERKFIDMKLHKSEEFIQNILQSVDEGFIVINRDYRIISANRACCNSAKMTIEEIIGRHCYEVSHHIQTPCFEAGEECAVKYTLDTGSPHTVLHTHYDNDGKVVYIETKSFPMKDKSGNVYAVIEVYNDITEKRKLEDQLHHAQKMEGIGTLAGGIAHDFNNILSAIIGYGHVTLMKMPKDDPFRTNIEHILESADRAASLTQSLLSFSRKQITNRNPVELNSVIRKVEKFLVRIIGEDIVVRLSLADGALNIFADAGQLEQVFMNLAINARDAMPNGGSFMIETSTIELDSGFVSAHGYGKTGVYAMISATDTGVGMTAEIREKIFEPFFTTKGVGKGTGLGLAMVYGILKQHEGFINVYSEPGKGTTFRIYLPLIKPEATAEQKTIELEYPKGGTETILLAEDDVSLRKLTMLVLEQMGYTVITANDGEEAVAKFMENKDRIQLLLFDIILPKKSGRDAYAEIRKVMRNVPALFVSGYSPDMLNEKDLIEEGAAIVYKPITPRDLSKKVREALDGVR